MTQYHIRQTVVTVVEADNFEQAIDRFHEANHIMREVREEQVSVPDKAGILTRVPAPEFG